MYTLQVNLNSEKFNGVACYFWCIFKHDNGKKYNCGHGWEHSIEDAYRVAHQYYLNNFANTPE